MPMALPVGNPTAWLPKLIRKDGVRPPSPMGFAAAAALLVIYKRATRAKKRVLRQFKAEEEADPARGTNKTRKVHVRSGGKLFVQFVSILQRCAGRREALDLLLLTACLSGRTWMTLWFNSNVASALGAFCNQAWGDLRNIVTRHCKMGIFAAVLNAGLRYYENRLALDLRECLTRKAHSLYMGNMNYYKANKVGDDKFEHADQLITDDLEKFSTISAEVYNKSLKPVVDVVMFSAALWRSEGWQGPVGLFSWFSIAAMISARVLPPFGKLAAKAQALEGRFRAAHTELINNGEMVAFMRGERPEQELLAEKFRHVREHEQQTHSLRFRSDIVQSYVNKYFASAVGLVLLVRPVVYDWNGMVSEGRLSSPAQLARFYMQESRNMNAIADGVLALFELQKRVGTLAGLTARVHGLFEGLSQRKPILQEAMARHASAHPPRMVQSETLRLEHVSIYKPDGVLLVSDLNIEVAKGQRVIITGDNGCGKSSLFRVMCGLWPLCAGTVHKPPNDAIYFLSQVNFVPAGSLRDVITYPLSAEQAKAKGVTDAQLLEALQMAHLADFRCDGALVQLDDVLEWGTSLSPGQKQRMAFARLLFKRPKYAILDECTNGISPEVERDLYERCTSLGMGIFSISHKVELKQLHDYELHYNADEQGSWQWIDLKQAAK